MAGKTRKIIVDEEEPLGGQNGSRLTYASSRLPIAI